MREQRSRIPYCCSAPRRSPIAIPTALLLFACIALPIPAESAEDRVPTRVLFVGNSYVTGIKKQLHARRMELGDGRAEFAFVTPGGFNLQRHLMDGAVKKRLAEERWDYVVLQEQSQTPALPGKFAAHFQGAVDEFVRMIRKNGAEPILFETWGYRDGDPRNPDMFPDYATMQLKLTRAYRNAGERTGAVVAPVGRAWSRVRVQDEAAGRLLYSADGSHPGLPGAYLASCVIIATIFNVDPIDFDCPDALSEADCQTIRSAAGGVLVRAAP